MLATFRFILAFALLVNNRLLMNLILVEAIGVIFIILFLFQNIFHDGLFTILVSIFILESVLGLMVLLLVLEATGSDFILSNFLTI